MVEVCLSALGFNLMADRRRVIGDNFELIEFLWVREVVPVVTGGDNLFESFGDLGDVGSGDVGLVAPINNHDKNFACATFHVWDVKQIK